MQEVVAPAARTETTMGRTVMGRGDYEAIAQELRLIRERALTHREKTMLSELASRLASVFRQRNGSFDTSRFLNAARCYEEG